MKKRFNFLVVLLVAGAINAKAQTLYRDSLAGVWVVKEVTLPNNTKLPAEELEAIKIFQSAVVDSRFHFNSNGLFEWKFSKEHPLFKELNFLNGQPWSIQEQQDLVHVGKPKENLMQIIVRKKGGLTYFILSDTPLLLLVKKE